MWKSSDAQRTDYSPVALIHLSGSAGAIHLSMKISQTFPRLLLACVLPLLIIFCVIVLRARAAEPPPEQVTVPQGMDHAKFDTLLKKYVNDQGLVNYAAWKASADDMSALNSYLKGFAPKPEKPAEGNERAAALANAYNAGVLSWILQNYPTESVWETKDPFTAKRYTIGGEQIALNDIENGALRPQIGIGAHSILVCAARSCPPLQRTAYTASSFESQNAKAYRVWLGRLDLNKFDAAKRKAEISSIFKWYKEDFDKAGGVKKVLAEKAPEKDHSFLAGGDYDVGYLSYHWGLNDQGEHGHSYSKANLIFDRIFH